MLLINPILLIPASDQRSPVCHNLLSKYNDKIFFTDNWVMRLQEKSQAGQAVHNLPGRGYV